MRLVVSLVLVLLCVVPAGAHGFDYVAADAQRSADGTVVVEAAFTTRPAWLVLHADDGGRPGAIVGRAHLPTANRFYAETRVEIEPAAWSNWTTGTVHPVLHADDGDGEFDPATDRPIASFGRSVSADITVERGPEPAYVSGEGDLPLALADAELTVREVAIPASGHLVVRNASGAVVGHAPLEAGVHRNVTVALEPSFYATTTNGTRPVTVTPVLDDGDGAFDDDDEPVTAGGAPVRTRFSVRRATNGSGDGGVVTAAPTTSPTRESTTTDGPGFGAPLAAVAVGVIAWRRR